MKKDNILALDIGSKRIGVARANKIAKIAQPLATINNDSALIKNVKTLLDQEEADLVVVGLPRGLDFQDTEQTQYTKRIAKKLEDAGINITYADEALSTVEADKKLEKQPKKDNRGLGVDAYAAAVILDNFMRDTEQKELYANKSS